MSTVLTEIDHALASFDASPSRRPVAIELGERKYTQLVLDVAQQPADAPHGLTLNTGRPLTYKGLEILRSEADANRVRVI